MGIGVGEEPPMLIEPGANGIHKGPQQKPEVQSCKKSKKAVSKRVSSQRFQSLNAFRDRGAIEGDLSPTMRLVWLIFWSHVDAATGLARISYQALAEKTGLDARWTRRLVKELVDKGFLEVANKGGPKSWEVNSYRVISIPSVQPSRGLNDTK